MNPAQLERLAEHLQQAAPVQEPRAARSAAAGGRRARSCAYADFLEQVLAEEVAAKTSKNVTMRTAMARFPFVKAAGDLRLRLPALDRQEAGPDASPPATSSSTATTSLVLGPARRRQDPPRRRPRA